MFWGMVAGLLLAAPAVQSQQEPAAVPRADGKARLTRIAVLDVQSSGNLDRKTVEGLSSLLASEVARRPTLAVVGGADLRALVGFERQRQLLGCTETSCLTEIAGALGVGYLVASEISKVGSSWLLSLTLLDANKAVALSRLTRRAFSDDALVDEAPGAVDELLGAMPGLPAPPPRTTPLASRPAAGGGAPESLPGFHAHDGFYLRMHAGFGTSRTSGGGLEISGPTGTFSVAMGGSVTEQLVVFGEIFDEVDTSPTVKRDGVKQSAAGTSVTHTILGYGVGAAYYVMPLNLYLSGTAAVGNASIDFTTLAGKVSVATKTGFIGRVSAGKEWWVSPNWGLGVALNLTAGWMADKDAAGTRLTSTAASVAFSATFN
jgi:hypothetical protein